MARRVVTVPALLLRHVEVDGRTGVDCLLRDGEIAAIGAELRADDAEELDGGGGALLPGLADHHVHLLAWAAAAHSFELSADAGLADLRALNAGSGWLRVIGWRDAHGDLDRDRLDDLVPGRPVRVQHRSGALWVLNSAGLDEAIRASGDPPSGAERDATGRLTGRLWREDGWLRAAAGALPSLHEVGAELAALGVTAVSDASPAYDDRAVAHLVQAVADGSLAQRVLLMGDDAGVRLPAGISLGPRKLLVPDNELPELQSLASAIADAHDSGRPVAVHCVSRPALALALAAVREVGPREGDRLEHCAIADASALAVLAELGVTVVTQPSFVAQRGDDYMRDHEDDEHDDLWRFGSLLMAGVPTVASSDAPYGDADPWATMRAARDRRTPSGAVLGPVECVETARTLAGFLADPVAPHLGPRRLRVGGPADLVLLDAPLAVALAQPARERVVATVIGGRLAHRAD